MRTQEILEAEKAIADMRNVLAVLMGTTDSKELVALVNKNSWMLDSFIQLVDRHRSVAMVRGPNYNPVAIYDAVQQGWMILGGFAHRKGLTDYIVAQQVPRIDAALEKIAQALRENRQ